MPNERWCGVAQLVYGAPGRARGSRNGKPLFIVVGVRSRMNVTSTVRTCSFKDGDLRRQVEPKLLPCGRYPFCNRHGCVLRVREMETKFNTSNL